MSSPLVFFQIASPDPGATQAFYKEVFDWSFGEPGADGRIAIDPGGPADFDPKGSITKSRDDGGSAVTLFIRVPDLWASVERAEALNADVVMPIRQIDGGAHISLIRDPDGMVVGIIQA